MIQTLRPITSLLLGVAFLLCGTGVLGIQLQLRGAEIGYSPTLLGGLTSAYFVGFLAGTFLSPALVRRIGHIRAFGFYAASCACGVLLHVLVESALAWLVLRLLVGMALVGLYSVIESWLTAQAPEHQRSTVFALYMMVNLGALAVSQQLVRVGADLPYVPMVLAALLVCASTLPVLATRMAQPVLQPVPRLALRRLFAAAPSAGAGALLSGLCMGAFWGLSPVWGTQVGMSTGQIATYMSMAILGGAALQLPLGRLSDRRDRRLALALVCAAACAVAFVAPLTAAIPGAAYVVAFLFGGMSFSIYPIVVAHLLDHLPPEEILGASSSVLLLNGAGSIVGPLVAGGLMTAIGPSSLFMWFAATLGAIALYALYRYRAFARTRASEPHFQPMLRTSHEALGLITPDEDSARHEETAPAR
ncbi:MFS transporter [Coralloluteibacterium stylophorae]|uniref:MFS transporter n=1 Tax=Coralloluteibacterium stylophorae TaxID=1776034 RepID=A0A8J7VVF9_9GAMM|nr:MFS transporter [Coralloluteibacterium stylophorae]MBS7456788.1 MFS transporter [Coralloluteibacterium stylophorae]